MNNKPEIYHVRAECDDGAYTNLAIMATTPEEAIKKAYPLANRYGKNIVHILKAQRWHEGPGAQSGFQSIIADETKPPTPPKPTTNTT